MQYRDEVFDTHPKALSRSYSTSWSQPGFPFAFRAPYAAKQLFSTNTVSKGVYLIETFLFIVHLASSCFQRRWYALETLLKPQVLYEIVNSIICAKS